MFNDSHKRMFQFLRIFYIKALLFRNFDRCLGAGKGGQIALSNQRSNALGSACVLSYCESAMASLKLSLATFSSPCFWAILPRPV